jgi:hypothetical protein
MKNRFPLFPLCTVLVSFLHCGAPPEDTCKPATTWNVSEFETNTKSQYALRSNANGIIDLMKQAEATPAVAATLAQLTAKYTQAPSALSEAMSAEQDEKIKKQFALFATSAGKTFVPSEPPPAEGGRYGAYVFSARGEHLRESFEKANFGLHYTLAFELAAAPITAKSVDQIAALFGTHASFPKDTEAAMNADAFSAEYAVRRTDPAQGENGIYLRMKAALQKARTESVVCRTQATTNLDAFMRDWEMVLISTSINYLHATIPLLDKATVSDEDKSVALHKLSEAAGFLQALRSVSSTRRRITNVQLDEVLSLLRMPTGGTVELHLFATNPTANVDRLAQARSKLGAAASLTESEINALKVTF